MGKPKGPRPVSEALREAVTRSGLPLLTIARAAGVQQAGLWRFVHEGQGMRLETVDRLAAHFGMELKKRGVRHE